MGLPLRYVRDLRPLTAIPLDAIFAFAPYAAPPRNRYRWGTPPPGSMGRCGEAHPRSLSRSGVPPAGTTLSRAKLPVRDDRTRSGCRREGGLSGGRKRGTGGDPAMVAASTLRKATNMAG